MQNERSQHKNKDTCLNMLKARLYEFEIQKKREKTKRHKILNRDRMGASN